MSAGRARRTDQNVSGLPFVRRVLVQPVYLAGVAAMTVGFLLQAFALRHGAVSTVILTFEPPLTMVLPAVVFHVHLSTRTYWAIAGMSIGLATLLLCADPAPGGKDPTVTDGLVTLPATAAALALLALMVTRSRDRRRAALLGVAAGGCFGLTAVLIKAAGIRLQDRYVALLTSSPGYLFVATGATSVYLFGRAVQAGRLATAAVVVSTVVLSRSPATDEEQAECGYPDERDTAITTIGLDSAGLRGRAALPAAPASGQAQKGSGEDRCPTDYDGCLAGG